MSTAGADAARMPEHLDSGGKVLGLLALDELLFVGSHAVSFCMAVGFHYLKNRRRLSAHSLHVLATAAGVALLVAIFGYDVLFMVLQVGLAWLILNTVSNSLTAALLILADSMAVLCYLQVKRLYTSDAGSVDFTAPVMISTQKLTSLAFNLYDYKVRERRPLPEENRRLMVEHRPSFVQLCSYVFFFHGVVVGPLSFYKNYIYFMEELPPNFKAAGRKRSLMRHLALTLALVFGMLFLVPKFPASSLADPAILAEWSFPKKLLMTYFVMLVARIKYYFAWNLGSCIQLTAGYGYDVEKRDWHGIKNVSIAKLELANSPKTYIDAWNTATNSWLRLLAHSRLPMSLKMPCTFVLSAMWHGFYPGYYFTFLFAVPITILARRVRRLLRWRVEAAGALPAYHVATWVATQLTMAYLVVPFTLLHYDIVVLYYSHMGWSLHIAVLVALAITFVIPPGGGRRQSQKQQQQQQQQQQQVLEQDAARAKEE